jgi:hypothetical protein
MVRLLVLLPLNIRSGYLWEVNRSLGKLHASEGRPSFRRSNC